MRDDDELRITGESFDDVIELVNVGIIKRCVYLIEYAKRRRLDQVNSKQQCNSCQCFFSATQLRNTQRTFSFWLGNDLNVTFSRVGRIEEDQIAIVVLRKQ